MIRKALGISLFAFVAAGSAFAGVQGRMTGMIVDATINYMVTFEAPGYQPYQEKMKLKLDELNEKNVELQPAGATPAGNAPATHTEIDTNVVAYNEGAKLFNEGKIPEAIAKF